MGRRKRGLFQRKVCLVGLNGGVKLYKCEILLLLFTNYPALCLTLPEISFYWHMQFFGFFPCCRYTHSLDGTFPACGSQRSKHIMRDQKSALVRGSIQSSIPGVGFLEWFTTKESLSYTPEHTHNNDGERQITKTPSMEKEHAFSYM